MNRHRGKITADTIKRLRKMRPMVADGASVYEAWFQQRDLSSVCVDDCSVRYALRRHVYPGNGTTSGGMLGMLDRQLSCMEKMPKAHALRWLDVVIDYAERELQGKV